MSSDTRADQIINELIKCAPAMMTGQDIVSVYLSVESLGKIMAYALDIRRREQIMLSDLDKHETLIFELRDEIARLERAKK